MALIVVQLQTQLTVLDFAFGIGLEPMVKGSCLRLGEFSMRAKFARVWSNGGLTISASQTVGRETRIARFWEDNKLTPKKW